MSFEFHLPTSEDMMATEEGMRMLKMVDDDNFSSALISGCPGSGKTTVSIYRFMRLIAQERNVHLITFQNMLVSLIRNQAGAGYIDTFNGWYYGLTGNGFNVKSPPDSEEMKSEVQDSPLFKAPLDELIIDEGQDLPSCVYHAVTEICSRLFVGADNGQKLHPHGAPEEEIVGIISKPGPFRRFDLGANFRNTYETYRFARQFIPAKNLAAWDKHILNRLKASGRRGPLPTVVTYKNASLRDEHLIKTLRNADGNVAILCPEGTRKRNSRPGECVDEMYDLLQRNGIKATKYHNELNVPEVFERYIVTTYKSAKGLEFDAVVIPRINYWLPYLAEWYVACTRAKRQLVVYRDLSEAQVDVIADFEDGTYEVVSL
jgi:DNA helicase IV